MSTLSEKNDVHNFIQTLENSARRIMRDAARKKKEADREEVGASLNRERKAKLQDKLSNGNNTGSKSKKDYSVLMASRANEMESTVSINYSVPKMMVTMGQTASSQLNHSVTTQLYGSDNINDYTSTANVQLSPIKTNSTQLQSFENTVPDRLFANVDGKHTKIDNVIPNVEPKKRSLVLDKLQKSPFLGSSSFETFNDILLNKQGKSERKDTDHQNLSAEKKETTWSLRLNAASIMAGKKDKSNVNKLHSKLMKESKKLSVDNAAELQGPIDYSIHGLKIKYRGEDSREASFANWMAVNSYSQKMFDTDEVVIPTVKIERHPLFVYFDNFITTENLTVLTRTKNRLLMKRFVFDVHEVWLSNLQHLREHQPARIIEDHNLDDLENFSRGTGLVGRRDVKGIEAMESQIQSISQKRVTEKGYYTTRMPEPKVVLDYLPRKCPNMWPPPVIPPVLEILAHSIPIKIFQNSLKKKSKDDLLNCNELGVDSVLLFIDRLLPTNDFLPEEGMVLDGVYWRFTLCRIHDGRMREFVCSEPSIASFVAPLIRIGSQELVEVIKPKVVYHTDNVEITWGQFDLCGNVTITLSAHRKTIGSNDLIQVEIRVQLTEEFDKRCLVCVYSSIEIEYALKYAIDDGQVQVDNAGWWLSQERENDCWPILIDKLFVDPTTVDDDGNPIPSNLCLRYEKTAADMVDGALATPLALACVQEVLARTRVDQYLNLFVEASPDLFFPPRYRHPKGHLEFPEDTEREILDSLNSCVVNKYWDHLADRVPSLSMRASGAISLVDTVPGACEYGKLGLWFEHKMPLEYTRVSAITYRDPAQSTTDTIFIRFTLALDTSLQFSTHLAWEDYPTFPEKSPNEEVECVIPCIVPRVYSLTQGKIINSREKRLSCAAMIFNSCPVEGMDHIPADFANPPAGVCRNWLFKNEFGFRKKLVEKLMDSDPILPTLAFGLTNKSTQPNIPGVNSRNIWHSTIAITEHINRPRVPKDYSYIICPNLSHGPNESAAFAIKLKHIECIGLSSSIFKEFEKEYADIQERRVVFARQMALEAKIEASELRLKMKAKEIKGKMQKEIQRALEKKLRKATKSEKGWAIRFNMSSVLEVQGDWERRRDDRNHLIFFHRLVENFVDGKEKYVETCQWDIPDTWDGDPLKLPVIPGQNGDDYGIESAYAISSVDRTHSIENEYDPNDPFGEPSEDWIPGAPVLDGSKLQSGGVPVQNLKRSAKSSVPHLSMNALNTSVKDDMSTSLGAEKSWANSHSMSIDTANLEHIAEQLISSDELMKILAKRLGIPEHQVVSADNMDSVFSAGGNTAKNGRKNVDNDGKIPAPMDAPRDVFLEDTQEPDMDSDDDAWSDDEFEAGDFDEDDVGYMPTNHKEVLEKKRQKYTEDNPGGSLPPNSVPALPLDAKGISSKNNSAAETSVGWRKLPRPELHARFFQLCGESKTIGPTPESANTFNAPIYLMPISPVDACQYTPMNFTTAIESIFIPDARKDAERAISTVERNIKREQDLAKHLPTDDLLLFGEAKEITSLDEYVAKQYKEDKNQHADPKIRATDQAILAAKSNNIAQMEDALEEEIPINTTDQFGNSLLLLAAQQGSKRMCKFLLRRGANINLQNAGGNTVLHFTYAYSQVELAEYLKKRGADDSILNIDGLSCYEGLNKDNLNTGDALDIN